MLTGIGIEIAIGGAIAICKCLVGYMVEPILGIETILPDHRLADQAPKK
jgi:hypothetical protein